MNNLMLDLSPKGGRLFFFAAVSREQIRDNEIESCRQEAAAQLSRFFGINAVRYIRNDSQGNSSRTFEAGDVAYNADLANELTSDLQLVESIRNNEGTSALFSYAYDKIPLYPELDLSGPEQPNWTVNAVSAKGFTLAVGFTGRHHYFARTLQQSDRNALASLLEQLEGTLESKQADLQTGQGSLNAGSIISRSSGTIEKAYIISRWRDEKGNMYSLVILPLQEEP